MTAPCAWAAATRWTALCASASPASSATNVAPISRLRFMSASAQRCDELLHALAVMLLARIHVALRVNRDAADREELSRISTAAPERAHRRQRVALQDVDLLVVTVGDEDEPLLLIVRERQVPRRPVRRHDAELPGHDRAERVLRDDGLSHERAVLPKHLNPVAAAIADVDLTVPGDLDARDVAKRFRGRVCRCVRRRRCTRGLLAIREPVAFVDALVRIEDDNAPVAGVGDEHFIRSGVVGDRGWAVQRRLAVGAIHFSRRADLQQELSVARELEHVSIAGHGRRGCRTCTGARRCFAAGGGRIVGPAAPTWGAGSRPAAAIQTLPFASTVRLPGDCGQA